VNCYVIFCSAKMSALNKCLMEYLSSLISKDASCNLLPVFDDYKSQVSDISAECSDQADTKSSTVAVTPSTAASPASVTAGQHYQPI